jgi:large subunit ribosomal protein L5
MATKKTKDVETTVAVKPKVTKAKAPAKKAAPKAAVEPKVEVAVAEKPAKKTKKAVVTSTPRLLQRYRTDIVPALFKSLQLSSVMQVPALEKIVVNVGVGDATGNAKLLEESVRELTDITGQKPVITKAKKSIATFKLREGQAIGAKVTLRGRKMYEFLDKLIAISLPRVRDFRGISRNAFDGRGNYTLGIKEQLIFPEINFDRVNKVRGMDIVIVTTAKNDDHAFALLQAFGMPFKQ